MQQGWLNSDQLYIGISPVTYRDNWIPTWLPNWSQPIQSCSTGCPVMQPAVRCITGIRLHNWHSQPSVQNKYRCQLHSQEIVFEGNLFLIIINMDYEFESVISILRILTALFDVLLFDQGTATVKKYIYSDAMMFLSFLWSSKHKKIPWSASPHQSMQSNFQSQLATCLPH